MKMGEAGHLIEEFPKSSESYQGTHAPFQETVTEELSLNKRGAPPRPHRRYSGKLNYRPRIRLLALGQRAVSGLTAICGGRCRRLACHTPKPCVQCGYSGAKQALYSEAPAGHRLSVSPELAWTCCDCADTRLQRNEPSGKGKAPPCWVELRQPRMRPAAVSLRRPANHSGESPVVTGSGLEIGTGTGNR